jgi:hypothetical protein
METKLTLQAQVAALRLLAEIGGYIVHKTEDVTKVFDGWTVEELDHYAKTREIPERFSRGSGKSGPVGPFVGRILS